MSSATVLSIVGNRPQYIKCAVVSALPARDLREVLLDTGQHYDYELAGVFFDELELPAPDIALGVGSGSHAVQTGRDADRHRGGDRRGRAGRRARLRRHQLDARRRARRRQAQRAGRARRGRAAFVRPHDARRGQPRARRPALRPALLPQRRRRREPAPRGHDRRAWSRPATSCSTWRCGRSRPGARPQVLAGLVAGRRARTCSRPATGRRTPTIAAGWPRSSAPSRRVDETGRLSRAPAHPGESRALRPAGGARAAACGSSTRSATSSRSAWSRTRASWPPTRAACRRRPTSSACRA